MRSVTSTGNWAALCAACGFIVLFAGECDSTSSGPVAALPDAPTVFSEVEAPGPDDTSEATQADDNQMAADTEANGDASIGGAETEYGSDETERRPGETDGAPTTEEVAVAVAEGVSIPPDDWRNPLDDDPPPPDDTQGSLPAEHEPGEIRLYWDCHDEFNPRRPPTELAGNPYLEGALVTAAWAGCEPARGQFDFTTLEAEITWWASRGKKVLIRNMPYALRTKVQITPDWIYEEGVTPLDFVPKPTDDITYRIPQAWDSPLFLTLYGEFVAELAARYDNDPRVDGVWIGVGHLGYTTANASKGGSAALPDAGWTPAKWEAYIEDVVDLYTDEFRNKPPFLAATAVWTRDYSNDAIAASMDRLSVYAAENGASLMLSGLDPDAATYDQRPFSGMLESVGNSGVPEGFTLFMRDDWPLWVNEDRRAASEHEADRDDEGFARALQLALDEWGRLDRLSDLVLVLHESEIAATTPGHAEYRPEVAEILEAFMAGGE